MSEFYDEYTDDEEENVTLDLGKNAKKYQKIIDEIIEETNQLETTITTTQLKNTQQILTKAHTPVKNIASSSNVKV